MNRRQTTIAIVSMLVAACGGGNSGGGDDTDPPDAHPSDAPPAASSTVCGAPLATSAPATITVSGLVSSPMGDLTDATVATVRDGDVIGTGTSGGDGTYAVAAATGGAAFDGEIRVEHPGLIGARLFPAAPLDADTTQPTAVLLDDNFRDILYSVGAVTRDPAAGTVVVWLQDCAGNGIEGATVEVSPAGASTIVYPRQDGSTGASTESSGGAYILNAPAGALTISGRFGAQSLHDHVITAGPSYTTMTQVVPR